MMQRQPTSANASEMLDAFLAGVKALRVFRHAVGVAIGALYEMDVVLTNGRAECSIHLFDIHAAIG